MYSGLLPAVFGRNVDVHAVPLGLHACDDVLQNLEGILAFGIGAQVAGGYDVAPCIEHHHGDGVVTAHDLQHKGQVGVLVGRREGAHGFGPHFHLAHLLFQQLVREAVGVDE